MRLPAAAVLFCFASPSLAHTGSVLAQDVPLGWPFAPELRARNRSLALRLLAVAISMMAGTILAASIGRL